MSPARKSLRIMTCMYSRLVIYTMKLLLHVAQIRQSAPRDAPNEETAKDLCADLPRPVSGEAPFGLIDSARVLRHTGSVDLQRNGNIPAVRKLGPGRETNLTTTTNSTSLDVDIVAVLEQDRVVTRVGDIDRTDLRASRSRYTEDATTAATSLDAVDVDVGAVSAVDLSGFVGETESRVASASTAVVAVHGADLCVGDLLEEKTAFSDVLADDRADVELVDVPGNMKSAYDLHAVYAIMSLPCLNAVRRAAVAGDGAHLDVCVGRSVAVESDTHSFFEVEVDGAQGEVCGAGEAHAEVRRAGHGEVGNLDAGLVGHFDVSSSALGGSGDGSAAFKSLSACDGDGASADVTGCDNGHTLSTADAIESALNS